MMDQRHHERAFTRRASQVDELEVRCDRYICLKGCYIEGPNPCSPMYRAGKRRGRDGAGNIISRRHFDTTVPRICC